MINLNQGKTFFNKRRHSNNKKEVTNLMVNGKFTLSCKKRLMTISQMKTFNVTQRPVTNCQQPVNYTIITYSPQTIHYVVMVLVQ